MPLCGNAPSETLRLEHGEPHPLKQSANQGVRDSYIPTNHHTPTQASESQNALQ